MILLKLLIKEMIPLIFFNIIIGVLFFPNNSLFVSAITTTTVTTSSFYTGYDPLVAGDELLLTSDSIYAGIYDDSKSMINLVDDKGINCICISAILTIDRCVFDGGSNTHRVLSIKNMPTGEQLYFYGIEIINGKTSGYAGGVYVDSSKAKFENVLFKNNIAAVSIYKSYHCKGKLNYYIGKSLYMILTSSYLYCLFIYNFIFNIILTLQIPFFSSFSHSNPTPNNYLRSK